MRHRKYAATNASSHDGAHRQWGRPASSGFPGCGTFNADNGAVLGELWWPVILMDPEWGPKERWGPERSKQWCFTVGKKEKRPESVRLIFSKLNLPFNWSENSSFSLPHTFYLVSNRSDMSPLGLARYEGGNMRAGTAVLLGRWGTTAQSSAQTCLWGMTHWHFTHLAGRGREKGN